MKILSRQQDHVHFVQNFKVQIDKIFTQKSSVRKRDDVLCFNSDTEKFKNLLYVRVERLLVRIRKLEIFLEDLCIMLKSLSSLLNEHLVNNMVNIF